MAAKNTKSAGCVACGGKGKSSKGHACVPCNGTGKSKKLWRSKLDSKPIRTKGDSAIPPRVVSPEDLNEQAVLAVLMERFKVAPCINGIEMLGTGRSKVWFVKPNTEKVVCAVVRTGKTPSVTFTKDQPDREPATKPVKKSKATGRGKAVVVYFNVANLAILKLAKQSAMKEDCGLNSIVAQALTKYLEK